MATKHLNIVPYFFRCIAKISAKLIAFLLNKFTAKKDNILFSFEIQNANHSIFFPILILLYFMVARIAYF